MQVLPASIPSTPNPFVPSCHYQHIPPQRVAATPPCKSCRQTRPHMCHANPTAACIATTTIQHPTGITPPPHKEYSRQETQKLSAGMVESSICAHDGNIMVTICVLSSLIYIPSLPNYEAYRPGTEKGMEPIIMGTAGVLTGNSAQEWFVNPPFTPTFPPTFPPTSNPFSTITCGCW